LSADNDTRAFERVGTVLNEKWTLERLLGVGGMAAVYAARHRNGARSAIKVLHPDLARHAEVRERFQREAYAANRVDHPGAVKVLDDGVVDDGPDEGTAYLVMELLEGESLQDRLERGPPVGEREFLAIAESVLGVLEVAHEQNVVHRDLKPENLFLVDWGQEAGRVKVLDFGLARLLDGQTITSYGLALGTPSFMSPEQAAGRIDEIDGRTDLFALAATGFRLRTGRRIHEGANAVELVGKMAHFAAPKVATYAPDVAPGFARVIDRALEFKRDDRYPDAASMRDDVQRALAEIDGIAQTQLAVSLPRPPAPSQPKPASPPKSSRPAASERPPRSERAAPSERPPALPPPLPPTGVEGALPSREATIEVSTRDIETSLPVLPTEPRRRRRRSLLPLLAVLLFAVIGTKLWLDARANDSPTADVDAGPAGSASSQPTTAVTTPPGTTPAPTRGAPTGGGATPTAVTGHAVPTAKPARTAAPRPTARPH